jgi:hypothetical protein
MSKSNLPELRQSRALFDIMGSIPDTIKDAINLCQKLDEQYLWVDSL